MIITPQSFWLFGKPQDILQQIKRSMRKIAYFYNLEFPGRSLPRQLKRPEKRRDLPHNFFPYGQAEIPFFRLTEYLAVPAPKSTDISQD